MERLRLKMIKNTRALALRRSWSLKRSNRVPLKLQVRFHCLKFTRFDDLSVFTPTEWDFDDITAQCMVFFLAGFDTVSTAVYFMAYSLATNPKVQAKVHQEINELVMSLNGRLPAYEDIQKLSYLDMVLSETLRMYPPVPTLDRRCNQMTTIENNDGSKVELQPGDVVFFPVTSIHKDPNYFPEPDKFIPERFSPENRDNIKPFSYLPFGVGPRNCKRNVQILSIFMVIECQTIAISRHWIAICIDGSEIFVLLPSHPFYH